MKSKKTVGQRVKIMRIPINWKSPPQKGYREPTPWGTPGLLVKKESPNMGTKTYFLDNRVIMASSCL